MNKYSRFIDIIRSLPGDALDELIQYAAELTKAGEKSGENGQSGSQIHGILSAVESRS